MRDAHRDGHNVSGPRLAGGIISTPLHYRAFTPMSGLRVWKIGAAKNPSDVRGRRNAAVDGVPESMIAANTGTT